MRGMAARSEGSKLNYGPQQYLYCFGRVTAMLLLG